jgi:cadmium resistance protein CadD (predicted permease)
MGIVAIKLLGNHKTEYSVPEELQALVGLLPLLLGTP